MHGESAYDFEGGTRLGTSGILARVAATKEPEEAHA